MIRRPGAERFVHRSPAPVLVRPAPVAGLHAGVAEVDLTPPPGMPKAGYSKNARDGDGFRTRLRARALHLREGSTSAVVLACDLLAGSAVVHRLLAERLADLDLPASGLLMTATHTHAAPGQASGSEMYNRWASNRPGFDPAWTRFVVDRLEDAVRRAVAGRVPARAAWGSTEVWGLTRNRSHAAHVLNPEVTDKRTERQRVYAGVDPVLRLLRVDDADGPLAAFTWFSIHGTGISQDEPSYHADLWAYLNDELAERVRAATGRRPVCGAAVATHGDMTPAVRPGVRAFYDVRRIGQGLGASAAALHATLSPHLGALPLAAGLREVDLAGHPQVDGIVLPAPRIGFPKAAGASENVTPVVDHLPLFRAGSRRSRPDPDQGVKLVAGGTSALHARLVAPDEAFPRILPVQVLRLGDTAVVGLPFEVTVTAGRRIAAAAADALGTGTAFVSSLANDHCDYLTTEEEYAAQHYEGASTLFGPRQQDFVAGLVRRLAEDVREHGGVHDLCPRTFDFSVHRYLARSEGRSVVRRLEPARFVEAGIQEDAHWQMCWTDVSPGDLRWHEPLVRVEAEQPDGTWSRVADDQGWFVGVSHLAAGRQGHRYAACWYDPPLGRPGRHRFVLEANAGQPEVAGDPFD